MENKLTLIILLKRVSLVASSYRLKPMAIYCFLLSFDIKVNLLISFCKERALAMHSIQNTLSKKISKNFAILFIYYIFDNMNYT